MKEDNKLNSPVATTALIFLQQYTQQACPACPHAQNFKYLKSSSEWYAIRRQSGTLAEMPLHEGIWAKECLERPSTPFCKLLGEVTCALMASGKELQQDSVHVQSLLLSRRQPLLNASLQFEARRTLQRWVGVRNALKKQSL